MTFRSLSRTPPCPRPVRRRVAAVLCTALFLLALSPGRVDAYPCGYATGGRVVSADCPSPARPSPERKRPGEPNLVSLAVFVAAVFGVLLIPIGQSRRGLDE